MKGVHTHTGGQEAGQSLVEYAMILVLVVIILIVVLGTLGSAIGNTFEHVVENLQGIGGDSGGEEPEEVEPERDCYGSLLLPYLVGLTTLLSLVFWLMPNRSSVMVKI